jgi:hypothetical protein
MLLEANPSDVLARLKVRVKRVDNGVNFNQVPDAKSKPVVSVIEKAPFTPAGKPKRTPTKHEYRGKLYTVSELAKLPECQVDAHTLRQRLLRRSVEAAVNDPKLDYKICDLKHALQPIVRYDYCGERLTLLQLSKRAGLTKAVLYERMQRGLSLDEALAFKPDMGKDGYVVDLVWKGVTYSIRDLCDVTGVVLSRIIADVIIGGLSVEVVVAKVHSRYKQYTYKGETYTFNELVRLTDVPAHLLRYRIDRLGWPVEKALKQIRRG